MPLLSTFERAFSLILAREGPDTDDPADPGGYTRFGIAQKYHPNVDVRNLTHDKAATIYKAEYWDVLSLDAVAVISPRVAIKMFDISVSQGQVRAGAWLQMALNKHGHRLGVDAKIGPRTLEALTMEVNEGHTGFVMDELRLLSLRQRIERVEQRPDQVSKFEGWVLRSLDLDGRFS